MKRKDWARSPPTTRWKGRSPSSPSCEFFRSRVSRHRTITFVSAISARAANPGTVGLAAINGAIESTLKPLARELKPLRINAVSPGVVEKRWWDKLAPNVREALLKQSAAASLVGRNSSPQELGSAIAFLVTNGFVNGTVMEIDGGLRLSSCRFGSVTKIQCLVRATLMNYIYDGINTR